MRSWLIRVGVNACALTVAAWLFAGITINGSSDRDRMLTLLLVALIFGVVNVFVRPVVAMLSLPLYLLTLGLFFFVVNALMLWLTSGLADLVDLGFHVKGFWTAVFGAIVISVVGWVIGLALPGTRTPSRRRSASWR
ncbi:MAG: phage holin family protein [Nocardioidaceae bacterium]